MASEMGMRPVGTGADGGGYPRDARARDRWILGHRDPSLRRVRDGGWDVREPMGVVPEWERQADGRLTPGGTVFLVNRECPWRCLMCDLWQYTLRRRVPPGAIPAQVDAALDRLAGGEWTGSSVTEDREPGGCGACCPLPWEWIKLYNAGSFFDPGAVPPEDDALLASRLQRFARVIVECHPRLVGERVWRFRGALGDATRLEVAMGLETVHPGVLERLNKGMTTADFKRAVGRLKERGCDVRAFVLVKPPFIGGEASAVEWAVRSVETALGWGVDVVTLIPVRGGNGALEVLEARDEFAPPGKDTVLAAWEEGRRLAARAGRRVFLDGWDIGRWVADPGERELLRRRIALG